MIKINSNETIVSMGYDRTETNIILNEGYGSLLPDPSTTGSFNIVWWNASDYLDPIDDPFIETVRCIARIGDNLIILRSQEGTLATDKNLPEKIYKMAIIPDKPDKLDTLSYYNVPQIHGKTKHDSTSVDGGAALGTATQIPAHGSGQHTGTIGDHQTNLSGIGTNTHTQIDTHISTNLTGVHGISGTPSSGQVVTATGANTANWQTPTVGTGISGYFREFWQGQGTVVQGSWSWVTAGPQSDYASVKGEGGGIWQNSSPGATLDEYKWSNIFLAAGTYKITIAYLKSSNYGIAEVLFGSTSLGTQDQYGGSNVYNQTWTFTFTVAASTTADMRFRCNGHNGSSSAYVVVFSRFQLEKTG